MAQFEYAGRKFISDTKYVTHRVMEMLMADSLEGTPVEGASFLNRSIEREFPGRYEVTGTYDRQTGLGTITLFDKEKGQEVFTMSRNMRYRSDIDHPHLMSVIDNY